MNEIYWIQRLDNIYGLLGALTFISAAIFLISGWWWLIRWMDCGDDETFGSRKKTKRALITSACTFLIAGAGLVFTPTTNEALMILGVGGAVDYIQENETLKELPDKCVKALEAWSDSLLEGEE